MRITLEEVRATAALARLSLSPEEEEEARRALDAILGHMAELAEVDVEGVPPMADLLASSPSLREDLVGPQLTPDEALAAAPCAVDGCFAVPRVISQGRERP